MSRILLVNPPYKSLYRAVKFKTPPLGLLYVAAFCEKAGFKVDLHDMNVGKTLDQDPDFDRYDVVGVTAETSRIKAAARLGKAARARGSLVVLGGPHAMFDADALFGDGVCDLIVCGEGEETFVEILQARKTGATFSEIPGLIYVGRDGKPVRTAKRSYKTPVDQYPLPARHLLDPEHHTSWTLGGRRVASILSSRGCPYDCVFCSSSQFTGRGFRPRSPRSVVDEVEHCVKEYGYEGVVFVDDNFTLNVKRVTDICDDLIARRLGIRFWALCRTDTIARSEELVKKMAEAGAFSFLMGVESPHQEVLDSFGKKTKVERTEQAMAMLRKYGIDAHPSYIIGNIDESRDMILETVRYARRLGTESAQFSLLTPFPGTRLFDENQDRIFDRDWDRYDTVHSVMRTDRVSPKALERLLFRAYLTFWLRPRKLWNGIVSPVRGKGLKILPLFRMLLALWRDRSPDRATGAAGITRPDAKAA